jgi:hypothetical protein
VTNPRAIVEISDFSNGSDTILELLSKYDVHAVTGRLSETSTPDLTGPKSGYLNKSGNESDH